MDKDAGDSRILLPNVEFYITNVCNLTCSNCNRFNDYDFKGWQRWGDYADLHAQWSKKIRLQRITILGGEPLLNPTILDWVDGINQLWNKPVQILTNGTRLNAVPNLYDRINQYGSSKPWLRHGTKNWIGVSLHNENDREHCFEEIKKFLKGNVKYVHINDPENVNNAYTYGAQHAFVDSNYMRVCVWEYTEFYNAAITRDKFGQLTLHNSNPSLAHKICGFARYKCFHFIRGQIYKCGPVALFPEFDLQHPLAIGTEDRELINSYRALNVNDSTEQISEFFNQHQPIPQCKFCPDNHSIIKLMAVSKKVGATSSYD